MAIVNSHSESNRLSLCNNRKGKKNCFSNLAYFFGLHHALFVFIHTLFLIAAPCLHEVQSRLSQQTIRYCEKRPDLRGLLATKCKKKKKCFWMWLPLGAGQHFCPGLVKFVEPARHHLVCVKTSVMLTRRAGDGVTFSDFWLLFARLPCCSVLNPGKVKGACKRHLIDTCQAGQSNRTSTRAVNRFPFVSRRLLP